MTAPGTLGASVWSSPSIDPANGTVWVTTGNNLAGTNESLSSAIVELYLSNLTVKAYWQVPGIAGLDDDFGAGATLVSGTHGAPVAIATNKDDTTYALNRSNPGAGPIWQDDVGGQAFQGDIAPAAAGGGYVYLAGGPVAPDNITYTYTGLPSGCSSNNVTTLTCKPSNGSGLSTIEVKGVDAAGHVGYANTSLTIATAGAFQVDRFSVSPEFGSPLGAQVMFTVGVANAAGSVPYAYTGLPSGCTSTSTPTLACAPSAVGSFRVEVNATDSMSHTASAILTLGVIPQSRGLTVLGFYNEAPTIVLGKAATLAVEMASSTVTGSVRAVYAGNGTTQWVHSTPGFLFAGPTYANGLVIDAAISGNFTWTTLEVLNAATGSRLAFYGVSGMVVGEPVVADGRIYFGTATSTFIGNGKFYALDLPLVAQPTGAIVTPPSNKGLTVEWQGTSVGGSPPYTCVWALNSTVHQSGCGSFQYTYATPLGVSPIGVRLNVTDSVGAFASANYTVSVSWQSCTGWCPHWMGAVENLTTEACSTGSPLQCPEPRTLSFASYESGGPSPYTYLWKFGDSTESTSAFPTHTYSEAGEYTVTLTVTDADEQQASLQLAVVVY